jgi:undecaprenyl-diphosphatase
MPTVLDRPTGAIHEFAVGHPWLTVPVIVITAACIAWCPLALVLAWLRSRKLRPIAATVLGLALADQVSYAIGSLGFRPRPFVALRFAPLFPHSPNTSFPSSTTAFAAATAIVVLLAWRRLGVTLVLGTAMIAFGCVYVGVHYVSDVVFGALIGAACGGGAWLAMGLGPAKKFLGQIDHRIAQRRSSG